MCATAGRAVGHVYVCERVAESASSSDIPHSGLPDVPSEEASAIAIAATVVPSVVVAAAVPSVSEVVPASAMVAAAGAVAASERIRKIRIWTRRRTEGERASAEHRLRAIEKERERDGNGTKMPLPPITETDSTGDQEGQEKSEGEFPLVRGGVSLSVLSSSPCPCPPLVSLSAAKERFLRDSRCCEMRCVLSAVVDLRGGSRVGILSVGPSTVCPSGGKDQVQDLLLVTARETAAADTSEEQDKGQGHSIASGGDEEAVSHVLLLDSSLRTLAVLWNDCSRSEREREIESSASVSASVSVSAADIPDSDPPIDCGSEDISITVTAARNVKPKGEGAQVAGMGSGSGSGSGTRTRKGSTPAQPAPVIVTSACLVSHPYQHQHRSSPPSLSYSVALTTAHSTDSQRQLSNKLLLWHPRLHPHTAAGLDATDSRPDTRTDGAQSNSSCHRDLISSLAVDGCDLPFNNTPPQSSSKSAGGGSRGQHMLLAARGTGLRQQVVLGDPNGHVWGATLGPESDFPGPMYPPGFTLMQRVMSYLECEDELDYPVHAAPPAATVTGPSASASIVLQLDRVPLSVSVPVPFINVGVCPLYRSSGASRAPRNTALSSSISISGWGSDEHAQQQEKEVSFRLTRRLPMQLVGDVRARFVEQKTRALMLRKASMARARSSTVALKRKAPSSKTTVKKKKKLNKGAAAARGGARAGDGCSVSDAGSSLPQDALSLGTAQLQEEEGDVPRTLVATAASPLTPVPLEGSEVEGEGDMYIEDGDAEHPDPSTRHGRGTKRRRLESAAAERDSEDSSQSENEGEGEENEGGPDPALVLAHGEGEGAGGPAKAGSSLALCDVLPVPRRVLTGDFALRVLKRKEVPLRTVLYCTALHCAALYCSILYCTVL